MASYSDRRPERIVSPKPPGKAVLVFAPKQTEQFKQRAVAVAWQCVEKGGGYECANVTAAITRDLHRAGYPIGQDLVKRSMDWLEINGWATQVIAGKRTVAFLMDPDVEVPTPPFVTLKRMRGRAMPATAPSVNGHVPSPTPEHVAAPPVPRKRPARSDPPWLAELVALVRSWHEEDPETATDWAQEALTWLR